MSVALYMDQHINGAVTRELRRCGVDCLTAEEDGNAALDDNSLLDRATTLQRVVVTQDTDFLALAHDYWAQGREFAGIVFSQQLRISVRQLINDLELIAKALERHETANTVIRLPL
jgi:predicted nuclease of predicted toxin-antitoxin system